MTRPLARALRFGDIIKVDWDFFIQNGGRATKPATDDRRWMVVTRAAMGREWVLLYVGEGPEATISHWPSLTGFELVEGAAS